MNGKLELDGGGEGFGCSYGKLLSRTFGLSEPHNNNNNNNNNFPT